MGKLKSRKFWITVAMLLGSVATAITGLNSDNEIIVVVGIVCGAVAGCIYNICESMVDASYAGEDEVFIEAGNEEVAG